MEAFRRRKADGDSQRLRFEVDSGSWTNAWALIRFCFAAQRVTIAVMSPLIVHIALDTLSRLRSGGVVLAFIERFNTAAGSMDAVGRTGRRGTWRGSGLGGTFICSILGSAHLSTARDLARWQNHCGGLAWRACGRGVGKTCAQLERIHG